MTKSDFFFGQICNEQITQCHLQQSTESGYGLH